MKPTNYTTADFDHSPLMFYYEVTQACDLVCEFRHICGGSRARTYAVTGDALESEPDCVYVPK